ncbi:MAG TPA: FAD:protein FMN transferase [Candidatus Dormibacteraeota bacterium]|nr:FAD:protein FMN transferase [Candidatus Dormibacteraeota bacterium]
MTRRVRVEHIMGTAISIDLRDAGVEDEAVEGAFDWLREVDARFSPFQPESEISRLGRGELTLEECAVDVGEVVSQCEDLRLETGGVFNAWRWRPDGRLDPSGLVKGWSVERAAALLARAGARNFCINAGGDIVVRGKPEPGRSWRIGIRHPRDATALAAMLHATDLAVATSGNYERGDHIRDARTGMPNGELLSLTVAGPSLTLADAYATVGFAMGIAGVAWVAGRSGYSPYAVTREGRVKYTDPFAALLATAD